MKYGIKENKIDLLLLVLAISCLFLYFWSNIPSVYMYDLTTALDRVIPLIPVFVIPYTSFHFFLMPATLAMLFIQPRRFQLRVFLISAIIMLLLSNLIFFIFPTYFPLRPELIDNSLYSRLIRFVYYMDNPCALCPSIHVNVSILCAIMWWQVWSRFSWFVIFWAVLVALSTLFIRQHFVIDVVTGVVMAFLCWRIGLQLTSQFFAREKEN